MSEFIRGISDSLLSTTKFLAKASMSSSTKTSHAPIKTNYS